MQSSRVIDIKIETSYFLIWELLIRFNYRVRALVCTIVVVIA